MMETQWYFGYECSFVGCAPYWFGEVAVPPWHPVRIEGFRGDKVFLLCGMWRVFTEGVEACQEVRDEVYAAAHELRNMQTQWDLLSPYEREYRVW